MLRCPAAPTDRTPNTTLSFEIGTFMLVAVPALNDIVHPGASVSRQTTSYVAPAGIPAGALQISSVLLSRLFVRTWTSRGAPGAEASVASVAAFIRATFAT